MSAAPGRPGHSDRVRVAIRLLAAQKVDEAEIMLREALERRADDPWALNALGGVALLRRDGATALRLISAAATLLPDDPEILANLASLHASAGRSDEAFICIDRAVERAPDHAGLWLRRAELLLAGHRPQEAAADAQRALEIDPDAVQGWLMRGLAAVAQGDRPMAVACFGEVVKLDETCAEAWRNLAELHDWAGETARAVDCAERAYLAAPGDPAGIVAFAVRIGDDDPERAAALAKRALALAPSFLPALELQARLSLVDGDERPALAALAAAARQGTGDKGEALLALARVLASAGRPADALVAAERAAAAGATAARALRNGCLFALGRFGEAYDAAGGQPARTVDAVVVPAGMPPGEMIFAARLLPRVAAQAGRVLPLAAHPLIAPLFVGVEGVASIADEPPDAGRALLLAEAMAHCRAEAGDLAMAAPYLRPDPARVDVWRDGLAALPGPRIGFVWHGGGRGVGLAAMLAAIEPSGTPVSLAVGEMREELVAAPHVIDGGRHVATPADLAAAVATLDLVVGPDCLAVHLAGALGRPVVVMLAVANHWIWQADGARAAFYPSAQLLRQTKIGDWSAIASELRWAVAARLEAAGG